MVMRGDSCSEGCGFESCRRILDGRDIIHIELLKKFYCLFEKTENIQIYKKRPGLAHFFKKTMSFKLFRKQNDFFLFANHFIYHFQLTLVLFMTFVHFMCD